MRSGTGGSAVAGSAGGRRANGRPPRGLGQRARWERWRDPCGKLAGTFGDGSRTIRGGFEGRLAAEAPSGQAGGPRDGMEPREGRERPVGKLAGSFRRRFENDSRTIRGGFEGRLVAEAPSGQAGGPRDGAEPGEGRERPVGTVAGSFRRRFENDSRTIRERFEDVLTTEAP
jgi:hypothetical protein